MMRERLWIVAGTFFGYALLFYLNDFLFGSLGFSEGVNWIYLPSGFRLMFVLIFAEWGAIGVVLASIFVSIFHYFDGDILSVLGSGLISGLAPLLARYICRDKLGMDLELRNLTPRMLISVSIVFAIMSSTMHQVFYTLRGHTSDFFASTAVMGLGDFVGTIIMLYLAKLALSRVRFHAV
jgi:hypothetical protein